MENISSPDQQKPIQRTSLSDTIRGLQKGEFSSDGKMQLVQLGHGRLTGNSDGCCHVTVKRLCSLDSLNELKMDSIELQKKITAGEIAILDTTGKALKVADETQALWSQEYSAGENIILEADEEDLDIELKDVNVNQNSDFSRYIYRPARSTTATVTSSKLEVVDGSKEEESTPSEKKKITKKKHIDPLLSAVKIRQKQIKGKQALTRIRRIKLTTRAAKKQRANMRRKHRKRLDRELTRAAEELRQENQKFRGWHESVFDKNTKKDGA